MGYNRFLAAMGQSSVVGDRGELRADHPPRNGSRAVSAIVHVDHTEIIAAIGRVSLPRRAAEVPTQPPIDHTG
jgi:hypothetical protein